MRWSDKIQGWYITEYINGYLALDYTHIIFKK